MKFTHTLFIYSLLILTTVYTHGQELEESHLPVESLKVQVPFLMISVFLAINKFSPSFVLANDLFGWLILGGKKLYESSLGSSSVGDCADKAIFTNKITKKMEQFLYIFFIFSGFKQCKYT